MRKLAIMLGMSAMLLAACGGSSTSLRGGSATSTTGTTGTTGTTTTTPAAKTLSVITSLAQIPSDGSKPATITALAKDANNNFVAGVPVTFTASSGGLAVTTATTDATGSATATLSAAGDPSNRVITVTATAGTATATVPVSVIGTSLTLTGSANLVQNSQGTYTVVLTNAGGVGIADTAVTLASAKGNTLSATTVTTDATGKQTFTLTGTNGGTDTITATALGQQATLSVAVSTQAFTFAAPAANTQVTLGTPATVTVNWSAAGVPETGQTVSFSSTRGTLSAATATVSATGTASVTISSTTAGPAVISATGTGVSSQVTIDFVATTPASVGVQASPSTIATQGQSTVTATVRDPQNNLVEGKVVNFTITQDSTGGSLSLASATTNAQGQASTVYTASTSTSATNGVQISATVAGTTVTGSTSLTVGGQTVFLSLGTGNTISAFSATQYSMPFTVQAIDSAGNGINNVSIAFSVRSLAYGKGTRGQGAPGTQVQTTSDPWSTYYSTAPTDTHAYAGLQLCTTEDVNNNGVLAGNDDYNGDGILEPGLVASTDVASALTASGGTASVNVIYPKDHALWVLVELTATATVSGTQSTTSTTFLLPILATDVAASVTDPPGYISPYGVATTCENPK